jgi:hypothetical protein
LTIEVQEIYLTAAYLLFDHQSCTSDLNPRHINTDLKMLKGFNHKDLTPVLLGLSQFIDSFPKFPDVFIIFPYPIFEGMDYMEQYLPEPVDG